MRCLVIGVALAACGRVGFDDPVDALPVTTSESPACGCAPDVSYVVMPGTDVVDTRPVVQHKLSIRLLADEDGTYRLTVNNVATWQMCLHARCCDGPMIACSSDGPLDMSLHRDQPAVVEMTTQDASVTSVTYQLLGPN